jgi:hypothetical protein
MGEVERAYSRLSWKLVESSTVLERFSRALLVETDSYSRRKSLVFGPAPNHLYQRDDE